MTRKVYILRYTQGGFELVTKAIIETEYNDYITYLVSEEDKRTNIIRKTKLNKVTKLGEFTYVAFFLHPSQFGGLKAEMCDLIQQDLGRLESALYRNKQQYSEFLYAKLGGKL